MRQSIKGSGLSREQVVDQMNELARAEGITTGGRAKEISIDLLEKWLSQSADHLIPWKLLPIFCFVVKSIDSMKPLLAPLDAHIINNEEWAMFEWSKAEKERRQILKRQKLLEGKMNL